MIINVKSKNAGQIDRFVEVRKAADGYEVWSGDEHIGDAGHLNLRLSSYKGVVLDQGDDELKIRVVTYAPLHTHSGYSLLDGAIRISDLVRKSEYYGAITDHGTMHGFLDFYKRMKSNQKHPIVGVEVYTEDLAGEKTLNHMVLLAKNETGLRNLMKISSNAYENFYYKPQASMDLLRKHSDGVIATSGCLGGLIPQLYLRGEDDKAEQAARLFLEIFGEDNFYIEIQRHHILDEKTVEPKLRALAKKLDIPLIATVDSHFCEKEDAHAHEVLLCLQTGKTMDETHMQFEGSGYHLMSSEEMESLFKDIPEVLDNTLLLAERCQYDLELNNITMPDFEIPDGFGTKVDYFEYLCKEGFRLRFEGTPMFSDPKYLERFQYEIDMIKQMKFAEYFLVVWDFIDYARRNGIMVGPGRGSAVGSLISYCLRITDIDPLPYGLFFERFLNPERVSWPDIDSDFDDTRRDEIIAYLTNKYGEDRVCKIITFGTLKAKMVVRDVARCLGHPVALGNRVAKLIPDELGMTLSKAMIMNAELKTAYNTEREVREIIDISKKLEGLPRHASQHACGLVISKDVVTENLPTVLAKNEQTGEKETTSQVTMTEVEELGLLKMDLLGLRTMGVIGNAFKQIKERHGLTLEMSKIPLDDPEVYRFLQTGNTAGVFQLESSGMTNLLRDIYQDIDDVDAKQAHQLFERLIAAVALYRPGPMDYIPTYIRNMTKPDAVTYEHPLLESILKNTYGVIVYQEQVMQIVQTLAGYSLGRADIVRKAMGKKKLDVMEQEQQIFIHGSADGVPGCIANGVPQEVAISVWDKMKRFAEYAFNKSHATAYAYIAVVTAWLSKYYPEEFNAALLNSVLDNSDKLQNYLYQCSKKQIPVLPPDVNLSGELFVVEDKSIRFGLRGLRSVCKSAELLVNVRGSEPFADLSDFSKRMGEAGAASKSLFEALIYSGALDRFEGNRHSKATVLQSLLNEAQTHWKNKESGQISFFDLDVIQESVQVVVPKLPEFSMEELLRKEKEYVGFYLSGHPLDEHQESIKRCGYLGIGDVINIGGGIKRDVETCGIVTGKRIFYSKKGDPIVNFTLEDRFHSISCVVFSNELDDNKEFIEEDKIVIVKGSYQNSPDWGAQIIVNTMYGVDQLKKQDVPDKIIVPISSKEDQELLFNIAELYQGDTPISIFAKEKEFATKKKVQFSTKLISVLKENFGDVKAEYPA